MELNIIKKELYKQKPNATFINVSKSGIIYETNIEINGDVEHIMFKIPIEDFGDGKFFFNIESQLLIRYIIQ